MLRQFWTVIIVGPLGLVLGACAVHFGSAAWPTQLPFHLPSWSRHPSARKPQSQPTSTPVVASVSVSAGDLRIMVKRCRPAGAGELLAPTEEGPAAAGAAFQCAASWRGGDPNKVVRALDQELDQLASARGYRCEVGSSFSGGTVDYFVFHTHRTLRNAAGAVSMEIWVTRGADAALTLIVQVGAASDAQKDSRLGQVAADLPVCRSGNMDIASSTTQIQDHLTKLARQTGRSAATARKAPGVKPRTRRERRA